MCHENLEHREAAAARDGKRLYERPRLTRAPHWSLKDRTGQYPVVQATSTAPLPIWGGEVLGGS